MDANSRFLLKAFRRYYRENRPVLPSRFARREYGFMFFDSSRVVRHLSFPKPADLNRYMYAQAPSHSYYSTAYYRRPDAPTMDEKEWLGADLVFDLDADHLEGAERMTYGEMMLQIRREMVNLVDSFLLDDLGFSEEEVGLVFSGGRGYHAHIESASVTSLGAHERREIVDYVTSKGLDIDRVFPFVPVPKQATVRGMQMVSISKYRSIPPADSGGWRLRMRRGLEDLVEDVCTTDNKELKRMYPSMKRTQNATLDGYREDLKKSRERVFATDKMGALKKGTQELLVRAMAEDVAHRLSGEVDEPVTADIKRLIRLPGSVHGKTGLKVMPLTLAELRGFDPLESAVPDEYSDDPVTITMRRAYELEMKGQRFKLDGTVEVPEYAAVFLIGRKAADLGDGTRKPLF